MRYVATLDDAEHEIELEEISAESFAITFGGHRFDADLRKVGPASFSIIIDGRSFDLEVVRDGDAIVVAGRAGATRLTIVDAARRAARAAAKQREVSGRVEIKSGMPGRVIAVLVAPGDEVKSGQGIVILEAMKLENELKSPKTGKVTEIRVTAGQTVEKGELLVVIE
ncbi:MAG TPA: biotin/lipoyl-containing protein [Candidatus Binataceae bacterium]|nr:biotin/lipoyl-containing protein [Candidatus Binataceae bacterium]HVA79925.1 biotin/lipoyl-containing protein [Candidatus Binataceae bacterium]